MPEQNHRNRRKGYRVYRFDGAWFDAEERRLHLRDEADPVKLTPYEGRFLELLITSPERQVGWVQLCNIFWEGKELEKAKNDLNVLKCKVAAKLKRSYIETMGEGRDEIYRFVPPVDLGLGNLPARNPLFVGGQKAFARLRSAQRASPDSGELHILYGEPEVGKSQLAIEYAYLYQNEYSFIHRIVADSDNQIRLDLRDLLQRTRDGSQFLHGDEDIVEEAKAWLTSHMGWLLIFDNVNFPGILYKYLSKGFSGHIVVTSTCQDWTPFQKKTAVKLIAVDPLTDDEVGTFVWRFLGRPVTDEVEQDSLSLLWIECGRKAGQLNLACEEILRRNIRVDEFVRQNRIIDKSDNSADKKGEMLQPSVSMSPVGRILEGRHSRAFLCLLAFLHPEDIEPFSFVKGLSEGNEDFKLLAGAIVANCDANIVQPLKSVLIPFRWAYVYSSTHGRILRQTYSLHRERQREILECLGEDKHGLALQVVQILANSLPAAEQATALCSDFLLHHAMCVFSWPDDLRSNLNARAEAGLLERIGGEFLRRARFEEAREYLTKSSSLYMTFGITEKNEVARLGGFLGIVYMKWGDRDRAEELLRNALNEIEGIQSMEWWRGFFFGT